jgi:hypothetical protein
MTSLILVIFFFATVLVVILVNGFRGPPFWHKIRKQPVRFRADLPARQIGDERFRVHKRGVASLAEGLYIACGAGALQLQDGYGALEGQHVRVVVEAYRLRRGWRRWHAGLVWLRVRESLAAL